MNFQQDLAFYINKNVADNAKKAMECTDKGTKSSCHNARLQYKIWLM